MLWGEGLYAKYYWGGRISMRRNLFVYEVTFMVKRVRITFVYNRQR